MSGVHARRVVALKKLHAIPQSHEVRVTEQVPAWHGNTKHPQA